MTAAAKIAEAQQKLMSLPRWEPDYVDYLGCRSKMIEDAEGDYLERTAVQEVIDGCAVSAADLADAQAQEIAKLRSALHDTEDRIERASDLCHNAQDWFSVDAAVFHGVSIFDWIMSPARAALGETP